MTSDSTGWTGAGSVESLPGFPFATYRAFVDAFTEGRAKVSGTNWDSFAVVRAVYGPAGVLGYYLVRFLPLLLAPTVVVLAISLHQVALLWALPTALLACVSASPNPNLLQYVFPVLLTLLGAWIGGALATSWVLRLDIAALCAQFASSAAIAILGYQIQAEIVKSESVLVRLCQQGYITVAPGIPDNRRVLL